MENITKTAYKLGEEPVLYARTPLLPFRIAAQTFERSPADLPEFLRTILHENPELRTAIAIASESLSREVEGLLDLGTSAKIRNSEDTCICSTSVNACYPLWTIRWYIARRHR